MTDNYSVTVTLKGTDQLSSPVGQATRSLRQLNTEAKSVSSGVTGMQRAMGGLQTVMTTVFTGVALAGAVRMGQQVYELGMETQRTETLFRSFGAQIGNTTTLLDRLRTATRGTVTDLDLMNASSSMLSMGIAKNADEVARLVDIGVTFAQARGEDVSASLQNLSMLLSNQSFLRLDTLGISSAEVRELSNGYRAAGMDSASAFTQAFLDVAEGMAPQMNAVAEATITPFQRMRVEIENITSDIADNFAYLVNSILEELGRLGSGGSGGASGQSLLNAQTVAGVYAPLFASSGVSAGSLSGQNISGALTAAILAQQSGMDMGSAGFMDLLTRNAFGLSSTDYAFNTDSGQQMLQQAASVVSWFNQYTAVVAAAQNSVTVASARTGGTLARPGFAASDNPTAGMGMLYSPYIFSVERQAQQLQTLLSGSVLQGGIRIISPEAAQDAENAAYAIETLVDRLDGAGLEDNLLTPLRAAAEASRAGADAAADWADNLANASLSQLFGQGSGGRLGEIDAGILASLEAGGASADTVAALRRAMGLDTGQLTEASLQFDEEVTPQLTALALQWGADAYLTARTAYEQSIADAAAAGRGGQAIDWAAVLGGSTGMSYYGWGAQGGSGGRRFTVNPGDTPGAVAARENMTVDEVLRATGAANAYSMPVGTFGGAPTSGMAAGGYFAPEMFDPLEASMLQAETSMANIAEDGAGLADDMQTATDKLAEGVDNVFSKRYTLELDLSVLGKDKLSQLIAELVNGAGGVTPGTSPRTGRSNIGRRQVDR
jgi:hypothetical protein